MNLQDEPLKGETEMIGERFRGYVVEKLIGKGGYGAVYKVRHEVLDTPYALKVLDPTIAADKPEYVKRFVREAKLASRLRHPNLVAVHDAGYDEENGVYYIVMDYVHGSTLRQAIALGGAMPEKEAVRIIGHVASALDAAGALGVVHRDIKPENIILMPDDTVKLIDLGVAKVGHEIDSLKTMANTVFGTPGYMSPEQAIDSSVVDTSSDIYSLGVVFYEMLCGHSPYSSDNTEKVVQELLSPKPLPDIRTFKPDVSLKLSAVLSLMCAKRREDRIKTPAEVLDTLKRLGYGACLPEPNERTALQPDATQTGKPFSYNIATDNANNTLSFDTKDTEVRDFVAALKRKRLMKRVLWWALAAVALSLAAWILAILSTSRA